MNDTILPYETINAGAGDQEFVRGCMDAFEQVTVSLTHTNVQAGPGRTQKECKQDWY